MISGSLPPMKCGVGDYTHHLSQALADVPGVRIGVLTDLRAREGLADRRYELLPGVRNWTLSEVPALLNTLRRWNPAVTHFQFPTQGYGRRIMPWFLPLILRICRRQVVQTWHEYCPMGRWRNFPVSLATGGLIAVRPNFLERMPPGYRWLNRHKKFRFIPNACTIPPILLSDNDRLSIRAQLGSPGKPLFTYFGFAYPAKGIEDLFQIADPDRHHILLICDLDSSDPYHKLILDHARDSRWRGSVTLLGFQPVQELARLLAASDVIVLPFREGGGLWNSSLHGAAAQGTFILTTSRERNGFEPDNNVYYAKPGDYKGMRQALHEYSGRRNPHSSPKVRITWPEIAKSHLDLYTQMQGRRT